MPYLLHKWAPGWGLPSVSAACTCVEVGAGTATFRDTSITGRTLLSVGKQTCRIIVLNFLGGRHTYGWHKQTSRCKSTTGQGVLLQACRLLTYFLGTCMQKEHVSPSTAFTA